MSYKSHYWGGSAGLFNIIPKETKLWSELEGGNTHLNQQLKNLCLFHNVIT